MLKFSLGTLLQYKPQISVHKVTLLVWGIYILHMNIQILESNKIDL